MLKMLILSVFFSTAVLGRNLWMQEREQHKFEVLRERIIAAREAYPSQHRKSEPDRVSSERKGDELSEILPEYQNITRDNPDFAGWIFIGGTKIDYPVMQTFWEPEYYLHRNFEGEDSYAGVPFVGFGDMKEGNGDIFIYGHNMRKGTMFADLLNFQNQNYCTEHPFIYLDTLWEKRRYEVFAVLEVTEEEWSREGGLFYDLESDFILNRREYLKKLEKRSLYQSGIRVDIQDKLIFLVTCSYDETNGRTAVVGRSIDMQYKKGIK